MSGLRDASYTTKLRKQRVLFADKVVQETTLGTNIKNSLVLEGGFSIRTSTDNDYYVAVQNGAVETTAAEQQSYINSVVPPNNIPVITVPDAPINLTAQTIGVDFVTISFILGNNGGSPITNYLYSINGGSFSLFSPPQTTSPVTITGLMTNTSYSIQLKAVNTVGIGAASSSLTFTTLNGPGAPTLTFSSSGDTVVYIYFTAGAANGSAITNYKYSTDGGITFTAFGTSIITSPVTITGLTDGTSYSIQLQAVNGNGVSPASNTLVVSPVTPSTSPLYIDYDPSNSSSYSGSGTTIHSIGSVNMFDGTFHGNVVFNSSNGGILDFDGNNNSYITCPSINLGNTISVCAWVYPRSKFNICGLFTNAGANTNTNGFKFQWNFWTNNPDALDIGFQAGNGSAGGDSYTPNNIVTLNTWQHLGYVFDKVNQQVIFFLNGVPVSVSNSSTVANINTNAAVNVGGYAGGYYTMNAKLGYIHVYNTALDATQLYNDFNASKSRFGF